MPRTTGGRRETPFDVLIAREWGDLSERELTRRTGVARETVTAWRNGRSVPRFHTVERLAKLLGVPTSEVADAIAQTVLLAKKATAP